MVLDPFKVLFHCNVPFPLAHGGQQVLIYELMSGLQKLGVDVEPLRWWDEHQSGDILHFFSPVEPFLTQLAKAKKFRLVMYEFNDVTIAKSDMVISFKRYVVQTLLKAFPSLAQRTTWPAYHDMDAMVFMNERAETVCKRIYGLSSSRCHVVPLGVRRSFLGLDRCNLQPSDDYLVSMSTIRPHKNTVLLAELAQEAQVPILFIGKPYAQDDPYFLAFRKLVDDRFVRYKGFVPEEEKVEILLRAKGFVLLSQIESFCIAAAEAAAAGCPLLLPRLPWSTCIYGRVATLLDMKASRTEMSRILKTFYRSSTRRKDPVMPIRTWDHVATDIRRVYEHVMSDPSPSR